MAESPYAKVLKSPIYYYVKNDGYKEREELQRILDCQDRTISGYSEMISFEPIRELENFSNLVMEKYSHVLDLTRYLDQELSSQLPPEKKMEYLELAKTSGTYSDRGNSNLNYRYATTSNDKRRNVQSIFDKVLSAFSPLSRKS